VRVAFRPDQAEARGSPEFGDRGSGDARSLGVVSFSSFVVQGELFEGFQARLERAGEFVPEFEGTAEVPLAFGEPRSFVPGLARNRIREAGGQAALIQAARF